MGESNKIHVDMVRETGEERVPGPKGTDVNTEYCVASLVQLPSAAMAHRI